MKGNRVNRGCMQTTGRILKLYSEILFVSNLYHLMQ